jgi:hypothetical protein
MGLIAYPYTMPKVIIIPFNQVDKVCRDAMLFANSCQSDFAFEIFPQGKIDRAILNRSSAEVVDMLEYLDKLKTDFGYEKDDLLLAFYNGVLKASSHRLANLYCAGARYDEDYPCTAVISLKYLGWDILEEKYNYDVQKHSILHLIIAGMIGAYTHLEAHDDIGCLLDFNLSLTSFNLKLKRGYYLCSSGEFGCYDQIEKEKYGSAILRLCDAFKTSNYQTIIQEIIMGDKIHVGDIKNNSGQIIVGKNIKISNSLNERKEIAGKIDDLIKLLRQETTIDEEQRQSLITSFDKVREEISEEEKPDQKKIYKWLLGTKTALEYLVLSHHVMEAIHWVYDSLNFITHT